MHLALPCSYLGLPVGRILRRTPCTILQHWRFHSPILRRFPVRTLLVPYVLAFLFWPSLHICTCAKTRTVNKSLATPKRIKNRYQNIIVVLGSSALTLFIVAGLSGLPVKLRVFKLFFRWASSFGKPVMLL